MTYFSALSSIIVFALAHVYLEKFQQPKWFIEAKLFHVTLIGTAVVFISIILSIVTFFVLLSVWTTIFVCSVISWKYRTQFTRLEKGEKNV